MRSRILSTRDLILAFLRPRAYALIWLGLLTCLLVEIACHPLVINHDCAYIVQGAQMMLEGKRLYIDFVDSNPPLAFYLSAVPVLLASALSIGKILAFSLCVFLLVAWSTWMVRRILGQRKGRVDPSDVELVAVFWVLLSLYVWNAGDFGQREHLFALLYLPFFLMRVSRWEDGEVTPAQAIGLGVAGAIGACIKPHFLLIAAAPEAFACVSKRTIRGLLRPEMLAFVGTGLSYGAHFLLLPAAMRDELFHHLVPFHLKAYDVYHEPLSSVLAYGASFFGVEANVVGMGAGLAALSFLLVPTRATELWRFARPLGVVTAAAVVVYLVQHTDWSYHAIPAVYGIVLLCAVMLTQARLLVFRGDEGAEGAFRLPLTRLQVAALGLGALGGAAGTVLSGGVAKLEETGVSQMISRYSSRGDAVAFVSTSIGASYPLLLQMERRPANRYPGNLPIVFVIALKERDRPLALREEARFVGELVDDITLKRPKIVFVDSAPNCQGCPPGFVISTYLSGFESFNRALASYNLVGYVRRFSVYVRSS